MKENVADFSRLYFRIIEMEFVLEKEELNIISAYEPQVGLEEYIKKKNLGKYGCKIQGISIAEKLIIGDLSGHIGNNHELLLGGFGMVLGTNEVRRF